MNKSPLKRQRCIELDSMLIHQKELSAHFLMIHQNFSFEKKKWGEEGRKVWTSMQIISLFLCVPKRNQFHNLCIEESCSIQPSKREFNEATLLMKTLLLPSSSQVIESWNAFFKWTNFQKLTLVEKFSFQQSYFPASSYKLWDTSSTFYAFHSDSSQIVSRKSLSTLPLSFWLANFWFRIYEIISNSDKI